jgi:hemerythrin-like domain-containing protein
VLRNKSLIPLSHQHQRSLALCVRLSRVIQAGEVDLAAWQAEIGQLFEQEIAIHFAAEELEVFPRAARFPEIRDLIEELQAEHGSLRQLFSQATAGSLDRSGLGELAEKLPAHIRKEERQLFEVMQQRMSAEELGALGSGLSRALAHAAQTCSVPSEATRLRPKRDRSQTKL